MVNGGGRSLRLLTYAISASDLRPLTIVNCQFTIDN